MGTRTSCRTVGRTPPKRQIVIVVTACRQTQSSLSISLTFSEPSPASGSAILAQQIHPVRRQTDCGDVRQKVNGRIELHQGEVIFVGKKVVLWVDNLLLGAPFNVRQRLHGAAKVVLAHANANLG